MFVDSHHDSAAAYGRMLQERRRKQAEEERRRAERRAAAMAQLEPLVGPAESGSVEAMREVVRLLTEGHGIAVEIREHMPSGVSAYANWGTRTITIPPIVDAGTFAVALHECGHVLASQCPGREPHRPDPSVRRWHHCIRCEVDAWLQAMRLVPFSRAMFDRLRSSLGSYRRSTPAAQAEIERLDRVSGTVTWAMERQKRRRFAEMKAQLDRARRTP